MLVLEDDPIQARYASAALSRCDLAEFGVVNDAHDALRRLRAQRWDVLLCDLRLPGMDGISLVRELATLNTPPQVIFTTTLDPRFLRSAELVARSSSVEVIGLIEKPLAVDALRDILAGGGHHAQANPALPAGRGFPVTERAALEALQDGRIQPWFQPQICCRSGRILGVEALARWYEPLHGILSPTTFLPTIAARNLDGQLAACILRQSLTAQQRWQADGLNVSVSINLSSAAMARHSVVQSLVDLSDACGARRENVVFEMTETLCDNAAEGSLFENLAELRMAGFGLAIDDFGIGYSSMARLRDIPFTELKIDRSFLEGLSHHPHQRAIVESMIGLAHRLGMHTVAEGVETEAHSKVIRELGCDREQGYLYGAPMPEWQLLSFCQARGMLPLAEHTLPPSSLCS
ncbi:hypothetical protein A9974_00105 [Achromobacter sp. UMC71]|nr:hypothetical protein [Achromobacter sp. UMC71]